MVIYIQQAQTRQTAGEVRYYNGELVLILGNLTHYLQKLLTSSSAFCWRLLISSVVI